MLLCSVKPFSKKYNLNNQVTLPALLSYLRNASCFALLNNSFSSINKTKTGSTFDFIVGVYGKNSKTAVTLKDVNLLIAEAKENQQYVFGHLNYGLKDRIENLQSRHVDLFDWPLIRLFIPETLILISSDEINIETNCEEECDIIYQIFLEASLLTNTINDEQTTSEVLPSVSRALYLTKIEEIKKHIHRGDIYEMNYCMEMKNENISIDPFWVYHQLCLQSPAPFSFFYRDGENYLLSSSPERFIKKTGNKIISQPIKGTARRGITKEEDASIKNDLLNNEKERSENVMIVDLVRNDLSRIAKRGTVKVDELFGIYSFPTVHQMISTISAEIKEDVSFSDIIRALFPMGSMTGAPKISAMKLIDQFEDFNRGIYSGSVGYIAPNGDFDFNVVIRSIIYNNAKKLLTIPVGSAITAASDAMQEYDECLLKAKGLLKSLGAQPINNAT